LEYPPLIYGFQQLLDLSALQCPECTSFKTYWTGYIEQFGICLTLCKIILLFRMYLFLFSLGLVM